jgi:Protein of unknown function (DUF2793)
MVDTPQMGITLLEVAQAQKEVTVNEAFMRIDALLNAGAISKTISTPPSVPAHGDVYIVPVNPIGVWQGKVNHIAYFDQIWRFITPKQGQSLWVHDALAFCYFDGATWVQVSDYGAPVLLGINAVADTTNRLSVTSDAVLFSAETDDMRSIISKTDANDTASILFQTNYSGRAEYGLIGNDDFTLKLSSDGSNFFPALTAQRSNRNITIHQQLDAPQSLFEHEEFLAADQFMPTFTNGATASALSNFGASAADIAQLSFADNVTRSAQVSFRIPQSWDASSMKLTMVWGHQVTGTATVKWAVSFALHRAGSPLSAAYSAAVETLSTSAAEIYTHSAEIALNHASMVAGDILTLRIARLGADPADSLSGSALLCGVHLKYRCAGLHRR